MIAIFGRQPQFWTPLKDFLQIFLRLIRHDAHDIAHVTRDGNQIFYGLFFGDHLAKAKLLARECFVVDEDQAAIRFLFQERISHFL